MLAVSLVILAGAASALAASSSHSSHAALAVLAAALSVSSSAAFSASSPQASCAALAVDGSAPLNVVAPYFASWNVDPSRDRLFFDVNWQDPQLLYLTSQIGGAHIRFGGTGADALFYEPGSAVPCPSTVPAVRECLNTTWWNALQALSANAHSPLIFGINIHPYNASSPPSGPFDATNARALLTHAKSAGQGLWGLELGNEQNQDMTAVQQAGALAVLSGVLDDVYGPGAADRPRLIGPDTHSFHDAGSSIATVLRYISDYVRAAGPILDAVSHHEYLEIDADNILNATFLDSSASIAAAVVSAVRSVNAEVAVWAGEIGPHNGGTTPNPNCAGNKVCGRFGSALWYADSMSAKAAAGYSAYCRQDVVGADYGLLNYTTHAPTPDYYMLKLWKTLVGATVLRVAPLPGTPSTRAYAYCAAGNSSAATLVLLNLAATATCVAPPTFAAPGDFMQYTLTAGDAAAGVQSATVALNGVTLALTAGGRLPALAGRAVPQAAGIQLPPVSLTFVTVPIAGVPACQ